MTVITIEIPDVTYNLIRQFLERIGKGQSRTDMTLENAIVATLSTFARLALLPEDEALRAVTAIGAVGALAGLDPSPEDLKRG